MRRAAVLVSRAGNTFTVQISVAGHEIVADEPASFGGQDQGPSPFGLLLASVGACTAIAIVDAAKQRGLPLEGVVVSVKHKQNVVPDSPSDPRLLISEIRRRVEIQGELTLSERQWLFDVGSSCPVSRTLARGVAMKAELSQQ